MESIRLNRTELDVTKICLGTADFGLKRDEKESFAILDRFMEMGGNFLDTANVYCKWVPGKGNCSERMIGKWLRDRHAYDRMIVASKGGHYSFLRKGVSRVTEKEVRKDLEESLTSLGLDHLDFYWLHRDNEGLSPEEITFFMKKLVGEGKIRFWGISNISTVRAIAFGSHLSGVSNQWSYALESPMMAKKKDQTLVWTDRELQDYMAKASLTLLPYTSGAQGCFAAMEKGKECHGLWDHEGNRALYPLLHAWGEKLGVSAYVIGQVWLLHQNFQVIPVMAVSRPSQLEDFARITELELPEECLKELTEARVQARIALWA